MARTRACVGVTTVCAAAVCALGPAAHTLSLARYQPGLAIAHQLARLATCAGAVARTLGDDQVHADNIVFKFSIRTSSMYKNTGLDSVTASRRH